MNQKMSTFILICSTLTFSYAYAENRALIMGISNYMNSPLPGVDTDIEHVQKLATAMQIPKENITVKRNSELTLAGMQKTLTDFEKTIKTGDRAFIYFSGHGRSYSNGKNQCAKAIVTQDLDSFDRETFQASIQPIITRASKTFVFLDTCFSGGIVATDKSATRDFVGNQARPKVLNKSDDSCAQGTNIADYRDFHVEAATSPNYYLLGAAGPMEYAIDGGSSVGGLATTAFIKCLDTPENADQDNDKVVTLHEAYVCAQKEVNRILPAAYSSQTLTEGNGPGGNVPVSFGFSNPSNQNTSIDAYALMNTVVSAADATQKVGVIPSRNQYQIGKDMLEMDITSSKNGYLTLLSVGTSGEIYQLFPNQYDKNNRITANTSFHIPTTGWNINASGPKGKDRFVAIVSNDQNRFANLGVPVSPFRKLDKNAKGVKDIMEVSLKPNQNCHNQNVSDRDFIVGSACASGYSAGQVDVIEAD
jgi:hypothetical protein